MVSKELSDSTLKLLEHPIPVLSNRLIMELMDARMIEIDGFEPERLAATEYQLVPARVRYRKYKGDEDTLMADGTVAITKERPYLLQGRESVVVSIPETIRLQKGLIAEFYPSSMCIDARMLVSGGRLHAGYSHAIVLGLYNSSDDEVLLTAEFPIARVTFCWLGTSNIPDYSGPDPAMYIAEIERLRAREDELRKKLGGE